MSDTIKLCKICEHYKNVNDGDFGGGASALRTNARHVCNRIPDEYKIDLVTGKRYTVSNAKDAEKERRSGSHLACGETGRYWKLK